MIYEFSGLVSVGEHGTLLLFQVAPPKAGRSKIVPECCYLFERYGIFNNS